MLLIEHLFATRCVGIVWEIGSFTDSKHIECTGMETKRFTFPDTVPLVQWEDGSVRVRNSRVTLDTIVGRMQMGDTTEEIHESFPTVSVTQIKEILAWYFANKAEADEFLEQNEAEAEEIRLEIQSRPEYKAMVETLHRRWEQLRKSR
ncbi:MAG TPA: DUF433 domain-containing protein [Pyrinomonadaceae bacterium]|nr:DUF433 domain-containing protein [Pyrinomonadaceae bacterium]